MYFVCWDYIRFHLDLNVLKSKTLVAITDETLFKNIKLVTLSNHTIIQLIRHTDLFNFL